MSFISDYEIALRLQNDLGRVPLNKTPAKKLKKEHTSIVDSEWEKLDPNPDIYILFQTFDKKFFWGKLESVEVKWSKRMYSCAGICSYKGKMGGCSISLSLPLLQLRPRKDLVETLLHEMIHAYLFLTANKRDREEHGPLFHEHMHRINKAAGTKITVYHSFHDEVAHYKQHWWRCNGPCQSRKPFFGLVKRSMNRAPGPHDFWFAEHLASCGGEFIKIKEPENFKPRKKRTKTNDESSLKKYITKQSEVSSVTSPKAKSLKNKNKSSGVKQNETLNTNKSPSSVATLTNYFSKVQSSDKKIDEFNKVFPAPEIKRVESDNIHGFSSSESDSLKNSNKSVTNTTKSVAPGFGTGLKSNKGGTLIMNPSTSSQNSNDKENTPEKQNVVPFSGRGHTLDPGAIADRSKSILLSMFEKKCSDPCKKTEVLPETKKNDNKSNRNPSRPENGSTIASKLNRDGIKTHSLNKIDKKRQNDGPSTPKTYNNGASSSAVAAANKEVENEAIVIDSESDEDTIIVSEQVVNCPVCGFQTLGSLINEHLDECAGLETVLENVQIFDDETDFEDPNQVKCPSCGFMCLEDEINVHLDACLS